MAVYFVVLTHTGKRGYTFFTTLEPSFGYYLAILIPVICNISVPLFYMISGAVLMERNETPWYILRRRLPRYLVVLVAASALMYLYYGRSNPSELSVGAFLRTIYTRNIIVPYWFLYSYVGFLLLLPFIRRIVCGMEGREWRYLFGLYLLFNGLIPILQFRLSGGEWYINSSLNISMIASDIFIYPALGYYLEQRRLSLRQLGVLWIFALLAVFLTVYMTRYKIELTGEVDEGRVGTFYKALRFLPAAAVYATVRELYTRPHRTDRLVCAMGGCTFGVYLIEQILREEGYPLCDIMCRYLPPLVSVLIYTGIVVMVGALIVWGVRLLPCVKKLI